MWLEATPSHTHRNIDILSGEALIQVLQDEPDAISVLLHQKCKVGEQVVEAALFAAMLSDIVIDQACG